MTLPAVPTDFALRKSLAQAADPACMPLVLIIAPDSERQRELAALATGYRIATADSGWAALQQARQLQPALILADELVDDDRWLLQVRSQPVLRDTPILMLCPAADRVRYLQRLRQGLRVVQVPPLDAEALRAQIEGTLLQTRDHETGPDRQRPRRLDGLAVLIVEDNCVNQLVLEDMLSAEGCLVTRADNGLEAVERIRQLGEPHYDAVLMDVQMPLMDGYEATRQLQRLAPLLPVIGLSAQTLPEEHERCRLAGMCDQLVKPVDIETLVTTLLRHVRGAAPMPCDLAPPAESAMATEPAIDWPLLQQRYARNPAFLHQLLTVFLHSNSGLAGQLRQAAQDRDPTTLAGLVHGLQGMAGSVAATSLQRHARSCEQAIQAGDPAWTVRAAELAATLDAIMALIQRRLES